MTSLTVIIPVYNEAKILKRQVRGLLKFCKSKNIHPYISIIDNASNDGTRKAADTIANKYIRYYHLPRKGIGLAIRQGIIRAKTKYVFIAGVDFPFGYSAVSDAWAIRNQFDVVINSKGHPKSILENSWQRKLSSKIYRTLLYSFFRLKTKDPQGSILARTNKVNAILKYCDADNAFFETQLIIHAERKHYRIKELPVKYLNPRKGSKFSIVKDGWQMFKQIIREKRKNNSKHQGTF